MRRPSTSRPIHILLRNLRRAYAEESGSALAELAVALSAIGLPLLLGTIYTGMLLFDSIELSNAAHVGALYAMQSNTNATDSAGIIAAARNEAPELGATLNVTPTIYYACSTALDGTQYSTQAAATAACTGGSNHALEFVKVTVSYAATPFARIAGFRRTVTETSVSVMEVEE